MTDTTGFELKKKKNLTEAGEWLAAYSVIKNSSWKSTSPIPWPFLTLWEILVAQRAILKYLDTS